MTAIALRSNDSEHSTADMPTATASYNGLLENTRNLPTGDVELNGKAPELYERE